MGGIFFLMLKPFDFVHALFDFAHITNRGSAKQQGKIMKIKPL